MAYDANPEKLRAFKREVMAYYRKNRREMAWRSDTRAYFIVVSEIMLQQTQVDRVRIKFTSFVKRFPDWQSLARASNHEVLAEWSGLGYNRRSLYLKRIAEAVAEKGEDILNSKDSLLELPGIGPNTAGSILAFAFNQPIPFIETNIRSAFIHFFFKDSEEKIPDSELFPLIEKALDKKNPREWYYALMDYGSYLKKLHLNPSRKSAHHVKQSSFKGSNRELRSNILKLIMTGKKPAIAVEKEFSATWDLAQIRKNLADMEKEGFIAKKSGMYQIA